MFLGHPVYIYINKTFPYMFPIAGQTAGPNELKLYGDTPGEPGG